MKYSKLSTKQTILVIGVVVIAGVFWAWKRTSTASAQVQYQTASATKGTLITSISASGNVTSGNSLSVVTDATGTVSKLYVKNGDKVTQGQKIAELTLDQDAEQKRAAAWASYLSAKNSLASNQAKLWDLQKAEFAANQTFMNGAVANNDSTSDPNYIQQNAGWLSAEAAYKNQQGVIQQSQAQVNSSWLSYRQTAPTITSPKTGIIANLTIAEGYVINTSSTSSSGSTSPTRLGAVVGENDPMQAKVTLSELDAPKVFSGQSVTMTLDAFPDKSFTGKVLVVDTNGQVSSGVTTYPATIVFDTTTQNVYPNMAVTAKIITAIKNDVLLVPSASIQTTDGQIYVKVLKHNAQTLVPVEIGLANDTQTEVVSGINEGDLVIIGSTSTGTTKTTTGTSVFGGMGGGAMRVGGH